MTTQSIVAYDYDTHKWIDGKAAVDLRKRQLSEEIATFQGPEGEDYAFFMGIDRFRALDLLQDSLSKLEMRFA